MEIIDTPDPMGTILTTEQGKNIYKLHLNYKKFRDGTLTLHDGHAALVQKAITNGADIIVVEFFNLVNLGWPIDSSDQILDSTTVLNLCDTHPNFTNMVDYIIYDADDLKQPIDTAVTALVNQRYTTEDYETKLNLVYGSTQFKRSLYMPTVRDNGGFTVVKSWKEGATELGFKHYVKKYLNIDTVFVNPVFYPGTTIPMFANVHVDQIPEYRDVYTAFNNLNSTDIRVKARLMEIKDSLAGSEYDIVNFVVIRNSNLIPSGKALISCRFTHTSGLNLPISAFIDD